MSEVSSVSVEGRRASVGFLHPLDVRWSTVRGPEAASRARAGASGVAGRKCVTKNCRERAHNALFGPFKVR